MTTDLTTRLLAEIDIRIVDAIGAQSRLSRGMETLLRALRKVVEIHRDWPSTIAYADGSVIEARECRVCVDGECGEICRTLRTVAEALGVTP